jgi:hypothetical protein
MEGKMANIKKRDWVEPAHPVIVQRFNDLVNIYKYLKIGFQEKINNAFDSVSKQIGFVITTTMPVTVRVSEQGKIEKVELGSNGLHGTLFDREFAGLLKELSGKPEDKVASGCYSLYLIWHDALKLKLRADWVEPAHFRVFQVASLQTAVADERLRQVRPEVKEPAHWFDAGIALVEDEEILISAIDEVYGDLKLAERIASARQESRQFIPGIREPAHFSPGVREPAHYLNIIENVLEMTAYQRLSPGIREPAHYRRLENLLENAQAQQMIAELKAVITKYGL